MYPMLWQRQMIGNQLTTATKSSNLDVRGALVTFVVANSTIDSFKTICRERSSLKSYMY